MAEDRVRVLTFLNQTVLELQNRLAALQEEDEDVQQIAEVQGKLEELGVAISFVNRQERFFNQDYAVLEKDRHRNSAPEPSLLSRFWGVLNSPLVLFGAGFLVFQKFGGKNAKTFGLIHLHVKSVKSSLWDRSFNFDHHHHNHNHK